MDEFTDEDIQLSVESADDTRFEFTLVSISGRKLTRNEVITALENYIFEVSSAEVERMNSTSTDH